MREPAVFKPRWPEGLEAGTTYKVFCDDTGRKGGSWLSIVISQDGDVWPSMQLWEDMPEGRPHPIPTIRIRTFAGGGRMLRTRQALLWLADAIRRDTEELQKKGHDV